MVGLLNQYHVGCSPTGIQYEFFSPPKFEKRSLNIHCRKLNLQIPMDLRTVDTSEITVEPAQPAPSASWGLIWWLVRPPSYQSILPRHSPGRGSYFRYFAILKSLPCFLVHNIHKTFTTTFPTVNWSVTDSV